MKSALAPKHVWDLTISEAREAYASIQLNNYVYAALVTDLAGNPPIGKRLKLKRFGLPPDVARAAQHLLNLVPYLGKEKPHIVRIHYVYRAYELFASIRKLNNREIEAVMTLLAGMAFLPIRAERLDDFSLWHHSIIREITHREEGILAACLNGCPVAEFEDIWRFEFEEPPPPDEPEQIYLYRFVPRIAHALIVMDENGTDPEQIARAWEYLEIRMLEYELEKDLGGEGVGIGNIRVGGQLRYRNTLYLYGGDFFRRQGNIKMARSWYLKDLMDPRLPEILQFYLTDMKTVERLFCAKQLSDSSTPELDTIIRTSVAAVLDHAQKYANDTLTAIEDTPGLDLAQVQIKTGNRTRLYAGEPSREPFLFALLYQWMFHGRSLENPQYDQIFEEL